MELSNNAKYWMRSWGHFSITKRGDEIKGWALDNDEYERVYRDAGDLRAMAAAAIEVADKLESPTLCSCDIPMPYPRKNYCTTCGLPIFGQRRILSDEEEQKI